MHKLQVRTASESSLCPTGTITCDFKLGKQPFSFEFIVCRALSRPCILGLDFLRKYKIELVGAQMENSNWTYISKCLLSL